MIVLLWHQTSVRKHKIFVFCAKWNSNMQTHIPNEHETLTQYCCNTGPSPVKLAQHLNNKLCFETGRFTDLCAEVIKVEPHVDVCGVMLSAHSVEVIRQAQAVQHQVWHKVNLLLKVMLLHATRGIQGKYHICLLSACCENIGGKQQIADLNK